jgi:hypothetical protein
VYHRQQRPSKWRGRHFPARSPRPLRPWKPSKVNRAPRHKQFLLTQDTPKAGRKVHTNSYHPIDVFPHLCLVRVRYLPHKQNVGSSLLCVIARRHELSVCAALCDV